MTEKLCGDADQKGRINPTEAQKHDAFEWLREKALAGHPHAHVAFQELVDLNALRRSPPSSEASAVVEVDRGFDKEPGKAPVPTVTVRFKVDDWDGRDKFAASVQNDTQRSYHFETDRSGPLPKERIVFSESGWIKCSDRMPSNDQDVLAYAHASNTIHVLWWEGGMWYDPYGADGGGFGGEKSISHWLPLPPSPSGVEEGVAPTQRKAND